MAQLRQILPEIFSEHALDLDKLKLLLGEHIADSERYTLNWAGKSDAYQALQRPTHNTLRPCPTESVDFDTTQNIFIESDNLEALKILQKSYAGKIKMIYIDPPYNTGNDFIYHDDFSQSQKDYEIAIGDRDVNGKLLKSFKKNSKDNGHYHSNWLNMMLPRLHLARTLLADDGVIFISIDDNEQAQLKLLCDEIFGGENFVEYFSWVKTSTPPSLSTKSRKTNEYILCYEKYKDGIKYNGENQSEGDEPLLNSGNKLAELQFPPNSIFFKFIENGVLKSGIYEKVELLNDIVIQNNFCQDVVRLKGEFKWTQSKLNDEILNGTSFIAKTEKLSIRFLRQEKGSKRPTNFIRDDIITPIISKKENNVGTNETATKEIKELFGTDIFDYPKPINLIKYLSNFKVNGNDIVLDFFAGSATTAHAIMQRNSEPNTSIQFIMVQLPEILDINNANVEQKRVIQNAIDFCNENNLPTNIAEISKERIRRSGAKIKSENPDKNMDTGFKVFKLAPSNFKAWQMDNDDIAGQLELYINPLKDNANETDIVYELLLKMGLKLTANIHFDNGVYWLTCDNKSYAIVLNSLSQDEFNKIIAKKPAKTVVLDKAFFNDSEKSNVILQFKDAGLNFESI